MDTNYTLGKLKETHCRAQKKKTPNLTTCAVLEGMVVKAYVPRGMVGLSLGEKNFIQGGISQDLRSDGRKRLTYRPLFVETGVIPQANGSTRVRMGATEVVSSVKGEYGKPGSLQPDKGKVIIYVDFSPTAAPMFEGQELISHL